MSPKLQAPPNSPKGKAEEPPAKSAAELRREKRRLAAASEAAQWVAAVTSASAPPAALEGDEDALRDWLGSGEVLITLCKVIAPDVVAPLLRKRGARSDAPTGGEAGGNDEYAKAKATARRMESVGTYLQCCRAIGVPELDLFNSVDLVQGKDLPAVVRNLHSLGRVAQTFDGFGGPYLGARLATRNTRSFSAAQLAEARAMPTGMMSKQHATASAVIQRESVSINASRAKAIASHQPAAEKKPALSQSERSADDDEPPALFEAVRPVTAPATAGRGRNVSWGVVTEEPVPPPTEEEPPTQPSPSILRKAHTADRIHFATMVASPAAGLMAAIAPEAAAIACRSGSMRPGWLSSSSEPSYEELRATNATALHRRRRRRRQHQRQHQHLQRLRPTLRSGRCCRSGSGSAPAVAEPPGRAERHGCVRIGTLWVYRRAFSRQRRLRLLLSRRFCRRRRRQPRRRPRHLLHRRAQRRCMHPRAAAAAMRGRSYM